MIGLDDIRTLTAGLRADPALSAVTVLEDYQRMLDVDPDAAPTQADDVAARRAAREEIRERIGRALDEVPTLDADRMLRALAEVVAATVRTNAYQDREAIALKLRPREISFAPLPRPAFEIWVHSPRVEGVHLRFGEIARGGLRWSDRREDFRTEILGLMKAQRVKNAVIVPTTGAA